MTEKKILEGTRVLLVEDNLANQKVALAMLKYLGATAIVASSGEEALALFPGSCADVILMDCQMPGMDGYETTRAIRGVEREQGISPTPIIALTANAMQKDRQLCLDVGMNDYLTKPIEYQLLGDTILKNIALLSQSPANASEPAERGAAQQSVNKAIPGGLDQAALAQLKAICEVDSLVAQILSIFLVESSRQMADLKNAYESGDAPLLAQVAHGLKSSSRNVGAMLLGQMLESLELAAKSGELAAAGIDELYRSIVDEYQIVVELVEGEMPSS